MGIRMASIALALFALAAAPSVAQDKGLDLPGEFSGTLTVGSEYVYRGIPQSNGPALQGSLRYTLGPIYAQAWASNSEAARGFGTKGANIELNYEGGVAFDMGWDVSASAYGRYYHFPDAPVFALTGEGADYWEVGGTLSKDFGVFAAGVDIAYSPDFGNGFGEAYNYAGAVSVPVPIFGDAWPIELVGEGGYQTFSSELLQDYGYYEAGAQTTVEGFVLFVGYSGNTLAETANEGVIGRVTRPF